MMSRMLVLSFCLFAAVPTSARPEQAESASVVAEQSQRTASAEPGILSLVPSDVETDHVLASGSASLAYTATAGAIDLYGQNGRRTAKIFYTAYVAKDRESARPVSFAFNGGPGAASAYLHLGLLGPKIVSFGPTGDDGRVPELAENAASWLPFTDLVFIDPVGTGWSRAESDELAGSFYGVQQDAESLAKFIALYVQRNDRLASPKYLVGESYGGFRAAKVAMAMKANQGLLPSGMVLVSPLLEGRFLSNSDDPLAASLQLPSLAAAEMERRGTFDVDKLADVERFAARDYLVSLAGPSPTGQAGDEFYQKVAELTGLNRDAVARVRGFVGDIYTKQAGGRGRIVSPYDASHVATDAYPEASYSRNDDPVLDGFTRAYGAAFASYARRELKFSCDLTYTLLNEDVNRRWAWDGRGGDRGRGSASVATDIRDLLSVIPGFKMLIAHGYSDVLTPYGVSRYVLDHLPPNLAAGRTELVKYEGGHMFYTDPGPREAFTRDARAFYESKRAE